MTKNPFSLYDFLGYVFPGALTLFSIYLLVLVKQTDNLKENIPLEIFEYNYWKYFLLPSLIKLFRWDSSFIIILISYVIGHLISFISSITIEIFAIWSYGYPSSFLQNKTPWYHYFDKKTFTRSKNKSSLDTVILVVKYIKRVVLLILLIPIAFFSLLLGQFFGFKYLVVKQMNPFHSKLLQEKRDVFYKNLGVLEEDNSMKNTEQDGHRLVYHYNYENKQFHRVKLDNYVALYGFLRSMCLIFNCISLYIIYQVLFIYNDVSIKILLFWLFIPGFISYLFYLDFLKFYRRFTLENMMCLITDVKMNTK